MKRMLNISENPPDDFENSDRFQRKVWFPLWFRAEQLLLYNVSVSFSINILEETNLLYWLRIDFEFPKISSTNYIGDFSILGLDNLYFITILTRKLQSSSFLEFLCKYFIIHKIPTLFT